MSTSDYWVASKLVDKKVKAYKKKIAQWHKNHPNEPVPNDDRDDETFNHQNLAYPVHSVPIKIYNSLSPAERSQLPSESNPLIRNKYTTSVDPRNYLTTFEYKINNQSIIWDYNTGYIHLTGIWKALGNSKADILNLLDNAPELEPYLRRVRGGFLKIQGSWLNYENCYKLATKICWKYRYALIPVFGPNFLNDVLKPSDFGYGELKLNSYLPGDPNDKTNENKRRRKKARNDDHKIKKLRTQSSVVNKNSLSNAEFCEMMLASDSLRQLKFSRPSSSSSCASEKPILHSSKSSLTASPPLCSLIKAAELQTQFHFQNYNAINNNYNSSMSRASTPLSTPVSTPISTPFSLPTPPTSRCLHKECDSKKYSKIPKNGSVNKMDIKGLIS